MRSGIRVHAVLAICLGSSLAALVACGAEDLESTPQAQAYRAQMKTIAAGDYEAYKKTLASGTLKRMLEQTQGRSPKEVMDFLKSMSPTDLKLTSVKVDGKKATLTASAKVDGQATTGWIDMEEEGGLWKVGKGSWAPAAAA
jgi:hypothetical protein